MAKAAKKKKKSTPKSARVTAKPKAAAKSSKPAKAAKKSAKPAKSVSRKPAPKIDPLNRKNYGAMTPMLAVSDIRRAADFYVKAFGFTVRGPIMDTPEGALHAELRLRETTLMLSPESREQNNLSANTIGNTPATLYILVDDVDTTFADAVAAGAQVTMPLMDMFWGDRCCQLADPDGNKWMVATHKADPTEEEMAEAMKKMMEGAQDGGYEAAAAASAGAESEY